MSDKKRIFVADDDRIVLASLRELLSQSGFSVESTYIPTEVEQKVKIFKPHLILLDLVMPQVDGFAVCEMLQNDKGTQGIPIIAISGLGNYADIERAYNLGVVAYFTKPYDFPKLLKEINRVIAYKEALQEERTFITAVLDTAGALIVVLSPEGAIARWNLACEQITGYTFEEVKGQPVWDIFLSGKEKETEKANFSKLNEGAHLTNNESIWMTKDGRGRMIAWSDTTLTDAEGKTKNIILTGIDITERKLAEEKLQAAYDELKKAHLQLLQSTKMAAVGRIANWVAHEIKNPLAVIIQGVEYLKSQIAADSELYKPAEIIVNAAMRADKIVKDLLDFSRQSSETMETVDIVPVIEESLSLVEHQMNLRNIKIGREFPAGLPAVKVDANQIKQVFINILVNAVEAMAENGSITISIKVCQESNANQYLEICFKDTGPGISEENISKVFETFFSTKKKGGSAGLGLSITKEIVEKHGGKIMLKSKPGEGTSAIIRLPASGTVI